ALVGGARQLYRRDGDDGDDCRADATEERMDDRRSLMFDVDHGRSGDQQERWCDEGHGYSCRADDPSGEEAEPHRELSSERAGHRLREREPLSVLVVVEPAPLLDQIAVHVADQRDRTAEPVGAELQEVAHEPTQRPAGTISSGLRYRSDRW